MIWSIFWEGSEMTSYSKGRNHDVRYDATAPNVALLIIGTSQYLAKHHI